MKYKYYVGIIQSEGSIRYVTACSHSTKIAHWKDGEKALPMTLTGAKDLVFGLRCNCYNAVVITAPKYETLFNPTKDEWFGIVRWCEDDIHEALINNGYEPTEEAIRLIRKNCEHHYFKDAMVETGWDYINAYIAENADDLTESEVF
jgi:hypothetical protein